MVNNQRNLDSRRQRKLRHTIIGDANIGYKNNGFAHIQEAMKPSKNVTSAVEKALIKRRRTEKRHSIDGQELGKKGANLLFKNDSTNHRHNRAQQNS